MKTIRFFNNTEKELERVRKQNQEADKERLDLGKRYFKEYGGRVGYFSLHCKYNPINRQEKGKRRDFSLKLIHSISMSKSL